MKGVFAVTGGLVTGRNHALIGKNNQDAYALIRDKEIALALVYDGCGRCPCSKVGAKMG